MSRTKFSPDPESAATSAMVAAHNTAEKTLTPRIVGEPLTQIQVAEASAIGTIEALKATGLYSGR